MKSTFTTTTSSTSKPSTILSLFKKSKKSSPSSSPSTTSAERRTPPSPTHSSSSSTETLEIQFSFDAHSAPFSTYTPSSEAAPPAYSSTLGAEEDLEVVEKQLDEKEIERQRKAMKLLEEDRRISEGLKGLGF